jgi:hypothetical protein
MKIAFLRTSAAVAIVFSVGLTALVHAEEPAGSGQAPVESQQAPRRILDQPSSRQVVDTSGPRPWSGSKCPWVMARR